MATLSHELKATYAFMERNANLVKRYWSWELVWLVYSIANSLSVIYIGLGIVMIAGEQNVDGQYLVLYLVVGTLVWRYLSIIFYWITDVIGMERWEGTRSTPSWLPSGVSLTWLVKLYSQSYTAWYSPGTSWLSR
jgi:ABC-2 type transport system permease protein